jgi:hypothetical protein
MSQATLQAPASDPTSIGPSSGPSCEKCGFLTMAAACPACGWYPSVGIYVEIDATFEALHGAPIPQAEGAAPPPEGLAKHLAVWKGLVPAWGWMLLGTTLAVFVACVAARVMTDASPTYRTVWGVSLLLGGAMTALVAHIACFVLMSSDDADLGVADLLVKPLRAWSRLLAELPRRVTVLNAANAGVTAALGAALVVGGIPYESLLDWGFKARAKPNLAGMIAEQAQKIEGKEKSMEEAVNDFAGKAAGDLTGDQPEVEKPRTPLDCVVIGYTARGDAKTGAKQIDSLLLAADARGKLKYIGAVRPLLEKVEMRELLRKFEQAPSSRPLVTTNATALWVRPKFTCRVTYTEWPDGSRPKQLKWDSLMEEVQLPW